MKAANIQNLYTCLTFICFGEPAIFGLFPDRDFQENGLFMNYHSKWKSKR